MSGPRYRVAVVQGGPSEEAEVSRVSAKAVWEAARRLGHVVGKFELDAFLAESIRAGGYEVVFPVVHGERGEDGCLQGLLETLEVPYVGSGVLASAAAMDKLFARRIFAAHGLRIAEGRLVPPSATATALEAASTLRSQLGPALVLKPRASGSGLGVSRFEAAATTQEIAAAIDVARKEGRELLCEALAAGVEATCGVLEDASVPRALASIEVETPNDAFYTFQARYAQGRSVHHCPGRFDPAVEEEIRRMALAAFGAIGCRDLARIDFMVEKARGAEGVVLLEINTMPGFTPTSLFPEAAAQAGMPFDALVETLISRAAGRKRGLARQPASMPR